MQFIDNKNNLRLTLSKQIQNNKQRFKLSGSSYNKTESGAKEKSYFRHPQEFQTGLLSRAAKYKL